MRLADRCSWVLAALYLGGCPVGGASSKQKPPSQEPSAPQSGPAASAQSRSLPSVLLMPPGRDPVTVHVQVARDEESRRRGLMFRTRMTEDAGMLFLFERSSPLTFWMRNTYIPLDMIFIDEEMRIVGVVENAEPLTDTSRSVPGESLYVLEVNAGFSRKNGLSKGTAVRFEGVAQTAGEEK